MANVRWDDLSPAECGWGALTRRLLFGWPFPCVISWRWGAHDTVFAMTHFPQPNSAKRASRAKLGGSVVVAIRSEGAQPVRGKLEKLSSTGGLLLLGQALEEGDFVEVSFLTSQGRVQGMAELLSPRKSTSACLQGFRFIALDDEDHTRLRMALDSFLDESVTRVPSSKGRGF